MSARQVDYTAVSIAYLSFIVLGMPGGLIGIVWSPHMRGDFSLGLDAVASLFLTFSVGYFIASFISGRLFSRFKIGVLLGGGCGLGALAFAGYALAPVWGMIVAWGFVAGFGAGILDGGMNIYFAAHFDSRLMNWLHAAFGIGSFLAPVIITGVLANGGSWRLGYGMIAGLYGGVAALFWLTPSRWLPINSQAAPDPARPPAPPASVASTLRLPVVWVGILIFAIFAGVEASTGQWSKSVFYEERGIRETVAGTWVALYWLSFTLGRITFGFVVQKVAAARLIRFCMAASLGGMALFVCNPFPASGVIAVSAFGFVYGPIFALLVTSTQERMGSLHAANAIGFQVAAATLGFGLLPGVLGITGVRLGLESIPVALLALVVMMVALYELWRRLPVAGGDSPSPPR